MNFFIGTSPMTSRNFPPSFWNSGPSRPPSLASHLASPAGPSDLYEAYHPGLHSLQATATATPDPWTAYSLSSQVGCKKLFHKL